MKYLLALVIFSTMACGMIAQEFERGVTFKLATQRKNSISNLEYDLFFKLSESDPILATIDMRFDLQDVSNPLVIDFNVSDPEIKSVTYHGNVVAYGLFNGHVVIPGEAIKKGKQAIRIEFVAGDRSLNRKEEFLYTLLVPDRASTVFPCFDQPDLKARFKLELDLPENWVSSANGPRSKSTNSETNRVVYQQTMPISTYLFAFAAGEFKKVERVVDGRRMTMYHRETDSEKVERNLDDVFNLHALSLNWMEDYTGIPYPFAKFDFVLIPSFQYGGMEHTGNIFYNADRLFLDKSATKDQKLGRASLIAHETAHMWFGNLVTMKWFDDVWLKEVFANFMAAKIVHPGFPGINHNLGFMMNHHPSAYGEDRSAGSYPIQQKLDNLKNAGTLYGRIIYQKAPVVMRQLETIIGRAKLQDGLQEYLTRFQFDNAVWDDLIEILDAKTDRDLKAWSDAWVKEPGTPEVASDFQADNEEITLNLRQVRRTPDARYWSQQVDLKFVRDGSVVHEARVMIDGDSTVVTLPARADGYDFYLANGSELGYGYFKLDSRSKSFLLSHAHEIKDDVIRGAARLALYESLVRGDLPAIELMESLLAGLDSEFESLNRQNILNQMNTVFWTFLSEKQRQEYATRMEKSLWNWIESNWEDGRECELDARSAYFKSLVNVATSSSSIKKLLEIWKSQDELNGLVLGENDRILLAAALAIRLPERFEEIVNGQMTLIENQDRKNRFRFVVPALSPTQKDRDEFFESLKDADNRRPERWALEGLGYLHHPLRSAESEKYILPSLELLEEIQSTGDIFFPKRWLVATLSGHRSSSAAAVVNEFLASRPEYPFRLKNKILQASDLLMKVSER